MEMANIAKENLENWKEWCRLCGSYDTLEEVNLKEVNEDFFRNLLLLFSVDIENLEFSSKICLDCSTFLMKISDFNEQIQKAGQMFEEIDLKEKTTKKVVYKAIRSKYLTDSKEKKKENYTSLENIIKTEDDSDFSIKSEEDLSDYSFNNQNENSEFDTSDENVFINSVSVIHSKKKSRKLKKGERKTKIENFLCPICGKEFKRKEGLNDHMVTHSDVRKFECPLCKRSSKLKKTLERHMYFHMEVKRYKCHFCEQTFRESKNCQIHSLKHHPKQSRELQKQRKKLFETNLKMTYNSLIEACIKMRKEAGENYEKRPKLIIIPPGEPGKRICITCGKKVSKKHLSEHMRTHDSDIKKERFDCSECDKSYTRRNNLRVHMENAHCKAYKPYECSYCHSSFRFIMEMNLHIENHHLDQEDETMKHENLIEDDKSDWGFQEYIEVTEEYEEENC